MMRGSNRALEELDDADADTKIRGMIYDSWHLLLHDDIEKALSHGNLLLYLPADTML